MKQENNQMKIEPHFVVDENGYKIAVQLTVEEFDSLKALAFKNMPFDENIKKMAKEPPGRPIPFEMHEEFCSANGTLLPDGNSFQVKAGSKASGIVDKTLEDQLKTIRKELIMLRVMMQDDDTGDYVFARDYEFPNPTYAASIVAGSARDGNICWICPETGQILGAF